MARKAQHFPEFPKIAEHTQALIKDFEIKTPSRQTPLRKPVRW